MSAASSKINILNFQFLKFKFDFLTDIPQYTNDMIGLKDSLNRSVGNEICLQVRLIELCSQWTRWIGHCSILVWECPARVPSVHDVVT